MSERESVSERVKASIANARRVSLVVRIAMALILVGTTGIALAFGYSVASAALPPWSAGEMASFLWLPLIVSAALVLLTAGVLLSAIARWR